MSNETGFLAVRSKFGREVEEMVRTIPQRAREFYGRHYLPANAELLNRIIRDAEKARDQAAGDPEYALGLAEHIMRSERAWIVSTREAESRFEAYFAEPRPRTQAGIDAFAKSYIGRWRAEHPVAARPGRMFAKSVDVDEEDVQAKRQRAIEGKAQAMKDEAIRKAQLDQESEAALD